MTTAVTCTTSTSTAFGILDSLRADVVDQPSPVAQRRNHTNLMLGDRLAGIPVAPEGRQFHRADLPSVRKPADLLDLPSDRFGCQRHAEMNGTIHIRALGRGTDLDLAGLTEDHRQRATKCEERRSP